MIKKMGKLSDALVEYLLAWWVIILSPLWLPVWIAYKIHKFNRMTTND